MVPRVKDNNRPWHAKDRFTGLLARAASKLQNFTNDHRLNIRRRYMAEILSIQRKALYNQSINQYVIYTCNKMV